MKDKAGKLKLGLMLAAAAAMAGALIWWRTAPPSLPVKVNVPTLSPLAADGAKVFARVCASCHGSHGAGSDRGPPLIHDIYNPGHHADAAFLFAVRQGVRAHHWNFGNMPAQPQVPDADVAAIVAYVREVQAANGIVSRPHRM